MKNRQYLFLCVGLIPLLVFILLPPVAPLTPLGMRAIGVFLCTIIWWVLVGVDYTSVLSIVLLVAVGIMAPDEAFARSFGHWLTLFLIGCFGLCEGLRSCGFTNRFALWFLSRPMLKGRPWLLMTAFFLACTLMGSVMSSTVTCMVFMTIAISIFKVMDYTKGHPVASLIMIGVAWAATASLAMTPIAHAGNLLMIEWLKNDLGYNISFLAWMIIGIPVGMLFSLMLVVFFRFIIKPDVRKFSSTSAAYARDELARVGPMSKREKISLGVFLGVLLVWLSPDIIKFWSPVAGAYISGMSYAVPALAGAALLCAIRPDGLPLLDFKSWFSRGVEWGSIMLMAAVMALGQVIGDPATGIPGFMQKMLAPLISGMPFYVFLPLIVLWVTLQTNFMSNIVSMTLVYSIAMPMAMEAGLGHPAALGVTIAAASNYAFILPPATTTTALVIGSGWASPVQMLRYGSRLIIPTVVFFAVVFYAFAVFVLGR